MSDELPELNQEKPDNTPIAAETELAPDEVKKKKRRDFWLGFGLWFGLNLAMSLCGWGLQAGITALSSAASSSNVNGLEQFTGLFTGIGALLGFLPLVINIAVMAYFAATNRQQVAFGMLAAFGTVLAIVVCLGVVLTAACFMTLSSTSFQ